MARQLRPDKRLRNKKNPPCHRNRILCFQVAEYDFFEKSIMQEAFVWLAQFGKTRVYRQTMKLAK